MSQAASMLFSFLVPFLVRYVVLLLVFHSFRLVYINLLFAALLFSFCPSTLSCKSFVLFLLFLLVLLIVFLCSFHFFIFCVTLARDFLLPASLLTSLLTSLLGCLLFVPCCLDLNLIPYLITSCIVPIMSLIILTMIILIMMMMIMLCDRVLE